MVVVGTPQLSLALTCSYDSQPLWNSDWGIATATCAVVGAVFVFGANKRKALLYERIERRLKQQIEDVDVDVF